MRRHWPTAPAAGRVLNRRPSIKEIEFLRGALRFDVAPFTHAVNALGGVRVVDAVQVLRFVFFGSFIVVHVRLSSLGHAWRARFEAMITGREEVDEAPEAGAAQGRTAKRRRRRHRAGRPRCGGAVRVMSPSAATRRR